LVPWPQFGNYSQAVNKAFTFVSCFSWFIALTVLTKALKELLHILCPVSSLLIEEKMPLIPILSIVAKV
jgi:hypothetical protein